MSTFKWSPYNAPDTAITSASLNSLSSTSYVYGPEIDNSTDLFQYADLSIALSSTVTPSGIPYLSVFVLPNMDGNYTASAGNPGTSYLAGTWAGGGGAVQFLQVRGLIICQKFRIVIQNNIGVAFPATNTSVCSIRRYSEQVV